MENQSARRLSLIDVAKGIGIILVVFNHSAPTTSFFRVVLSFHMPLFFYLSGFIASLQPSPEKLAKRVSSLLVPYFLFSALVVLEIPVRPTIVPIGIRETVKALFAVFVHGSPPANLPLWFLVSLFMVSGFHKQIVQQCKGQGTIVRFAVLVVCAVMAEAVAKGPSWVRSLWMPLMLGTVPFGLFWYTAGYYSNRTIRRFDSYIVPPWIGFSIALVLLVIPILAYSPSSVKPFNIFRMKTGSWGVLSFPLSAFGIVATLFLSKVPTGIVRQALSFIGRNSIVFFSTEFIIRPYIGHVTSLAPWLCQHHGLLRITQSTLSFLVLLSLSPILIRILVHLRRFWLALPLISNIDCLRENEKGS